MKCESFSALDDYHGVGGDDFLSTGIPLSAFDLYFATIIFIDGDSHPRFFAGEFIFDRVIRGLSHEDFFHAMAQDEKQQH